MEKLVIGKVIIQYDMTGKVTTSSFFPTMKIDLDPALVQLMNSADGLNEQSLKQKADLVLGAWFTKMNEIELSDKYRYVVGSEVVECKKYSGGGIERCVLEYFFKEREEVLN